MISRIIDLIVTELNLIRKANGEPPIQSDLVYGNRAVESTSVTPRIVWSYSSFNITPTKHIGTNPHQGSSMEADVVVHCFEKTPEKLFFLINDVMAATRIALCEPSVRRGSGQFLDPGEVSQNGFGASFTLTLDVTITDPGLRYVNIAQTVNVGAFIGIQPQL